MGEGFKIIERGGTTRTKKKKWLLTGMVLALLGITLFGSNAAEAAAPEGVLKEAIHWSISADWLDPATCGYSFSTALTLYLLHDALLKFMPEGTYTPCLAESWSSSQDKKVWDFKLRKGVKFHNGDTVIITQVFRQYGINITKRLTRRSGRI